MKASRVRDIKLAQRASAIQKEIAQLLINVAQDEPQLQGLYISRVKLSKDGGICTIYFLAEGGEEAFHKKLAILILYKPSMRSALAKTLQKKYTPELVFKYDEQFEKQRKVDELIDKLKEEGKL